MEKQPDEPENVKNEPIPSMSEPMEVQNAVASTLATQFSQLITTASKTKAQRQREYRQRIAATRTPAEAAAARKYRTERQRYNRLRKAAKLATASGSFEATTSSSPKPAAPKTRAQIQREYRQRMAASITPEQAAAAREARNARERNNRLRQAANLAKAGGSLEAATTSHSGQRFTTVTIDNQRKFTDIQRQTLAKETAESTVQPSTLDQIEVQVPSTWPSSVMRFQSTSLDNDFGYTCSVCERPRLSNDLKAITAAQLEDQTKMLIAKVYHYFEQEYEELKKMYGNLDLSPLSKFRERTAEATGVSDSMLQQILEEERRREEEEETRAHKRRRQEDSSKTNDSSPSLQNNQMENEGESSTTNKLLSPSEQQKSVDIG